MAKPPSPLSGLHQPGDRLGRLVNLHVRDVAALGDCLGNAVSQVVFEQAKCHRLQRPGRRGHLGEDVDAVLVVLDHLLQAADLALDPAQPPEVVFLVRGVSVHAASWSSGCHITIPPNGISGRCRRRPSRPGSAGSRAGSGVRLRRMELVYSGKIRDVYADGDDILLVASDKVSVYDVVLPTPIPDKGKILTQLSLWWFDQLSDLVPNHVISGTDVPPQWAGRAIRCRRLTMLPVECIARGYLAGLGLDSYRAIGAISGVPLP